MLINLTNYMEEKEYIQSGYNDKYPWKITTWKWGDSIPDWLSDRAKVSFIDGNGNLTLETHETSSGGIEIVSSSGSGILVKLVSKKDYVCIENSEEGNIFTLTETQLNLLYKPLKQKENGRKKSSKS